jgi:hypothetical protein
MPAYTLANGPCHWDLSLRFYIALGARYARNVGALRHDNSIDAGLVRQFTRPLLEQAQEAFDRIFNPRLEKYGEYRMFEFGACCSFHITAEFLPLPPALSGTRDRDEVLRGLPPGSGVIVAEDLNIASHPHAIGDGTGIVVPVSSVSSHTLAHEIGHSLGLPDMYSHPAVPALGTPALDLPPDVENANRGRLMGQPLHGRRELHQDEIEAIAVNTGMVCDRATCCPERADERGAREASGEKCLRSMAPTIIELPDASDARRR